jgi:pimeloyl-ACP methyl ester carboxylesterase
LSNKTRALALAGAAVGLAAGITAERVAVKRRRAADPERDADFGSRRGERSHKLDLSDGGRIFVEEVGPAGAKRAAVFIHGSALRTDLWYYQLAGLGNHRLVFYDLRGHGLSQPKGSSPYGVATLANDLAEVLERTGVEEAVLVGHSVGGMVALELAHLKPELLGSTIKGIVLVNTTHHPPVETITGAAAVARLERFTRRPFDIMGKQSARLDKLRAVIKPSDALFWGVAFAAFGPRASAKQIDFTYDMVAETPSDVILDLFKCYREFDATERLHEITVPALVIGGSHDRITIAQASERMVEDLPKAELKIFEDTGHMTMLERHEEFNELLERFLDDTLGRPRRRKRKAIREERRK